jgi:hypothetical protein
VGFVAIARARAIVATKPSYGVGFVSLARRVPTTATKPSCGVRFVSLARRVPTIAMRRWPGGHDGDCWDAHWRDYLRFYARGLRRC